MGRSAASKAAAVLGKKGARKGGLARAEMLTQEERSAIARKGGLAKAAKQRKGRKPRKTARAAA